MNRPWERSPSWTQDAAFFVGALILAVLVGLALPREPLAGLAVALIVLIAGLALSRPMLLVLASMATLPLAYRVGGGSGLMTISDALLFLAFIPAVVARRRPMSRPVVTILVIDAVYQFATLFTVIQNFYQANAVEWTRAWFLVSGSLIIGWSIGAAGMARQACNLMAISGMALAVITLATAGLQYSRGNFSAVFPSFPFEMHKNYVGSTLGFLAVLAYTRPTWLRWSTAWGQTIFLTCVAAILASQSRQAVIGVGAALVYLVSRSDATRRRSRVAVIVSAALGMWVASLVQEQVASGNRFNSVFQRLTWFADAMGIWQSDPWFGVGLRWWLTDRFQDPFQPPNAIVEVLTSAGLVGLIPFVVLSVASFVVFHRLDPSVGQLAATVMLYRLVQSQFDQYWISVAASMPFVIAGLCAGAAVVHTHSPDPPQPLLAEASRYTTPVLSTESMRPTTESRRDGPVRVGSVRVESTRGGT